MCEQHGIIAHVGGSPKLGRLKVLNPGFSVLVDGLELLDMFAVVPEL